MRRRAVEALFALLDPERPDGRAVEPLVAAARAAQDRPEELLLLVELLGRTGAERVAPTLLVYAGAPRVRLRRAAIRALGMVRAASAESVLLAALSDEEPALRREAALALRRAGGPGAARPLIELFDRAPEQDALWIAVALAGPLSRSEDGALVGALEQRLVRAPGGQRDALLEAIAAAPGAQGALARAAEGGGSRSRAKVAELLAGQPGAGALLRRLAEEEGATRQNALWSLGFVGGARDLKLLADALRDSDPRAAANAAVSWGRLADSSSDPAALCAALGSDHPAVRVGALTGLRVSGLGCGGAERQLMVDASPFVRLAAAQLLRGRPGEPEAVRALARCVDDDRDGRVAAACRSSAPPPQQLAVAPLTVFVFGARGSEPGPGLPYALRFADGTVRHGIADRRGAVYEARPVQGNVELDVPLLDSAPHGATL